LKETAQLNNKIMMSYSKKQTKLKLVTGLTCWATASERSPLSAYFSITAWAFASISALLCERAII
jgi:hypothetical protein